MSQTKQSVLITGCSTGIGLDSAITLSKLGYHVLATARKQTDVDKLIALGLSAHLLDLADESSIDAAFSWAMEQTGNRLYALFNNGAYGQAGALEDLPSHALKEQFSINVFGWHYLTRLVLPVMRKQGNGRIIQNSSVLGLVAMPYRGAYNASKFAIEGYTDTLRLELRGSGIQVSLIEPGPIDTKFRANALIKLNEYVDIESSLHRDNYKDHIERLSSEGPNGKFTLPASAVTKKVIHALSSQKSKARYYVTKPTYIMAFFKRILPFTWLDSILAKG
jgi:NAD(P)-dependent dehydrogenase (short-subunit alcohol dehydrogenase family)